MCASPAGLRKKLSVETSVFFWHFYWHTYAHTHTDRDFYYY